MWLFYARNIDKCQTGMVYWNRNELYYSFDAANFYYRGAWYWVSLAIPVACMLADSSLLLQYQHPEDLEALMRRADDRMYQVKEKMKRV